MLSGMRQQPEAALGRRRRRSRRRGWRVAQAPHALQPRAVGFELRARPAKRAHDARVGVVHDPVARVQVVGEAARVGEAAVGQRGAALLRQLRRVAFFARAGVGARIVPALYRFDVTERKKNPPRNTYIRRVS